MENSEKDDLIAHYFNPIHTGKYDWDKISLIEKERSEQIEAIRNFCKGHEIRMSGLHSIFDYHVSWGFARILMGWRYYRNPVVFRDLLKLCYDLIEPYPEIKINIHHSNIEFVTETHYIRTEALDERFRLECEYPKKFIQHFPVEAWKKTSDLLERHQEYLMSLSKVKSFNIRPGFAITESPFIRLATDEKAESELASKGIYGFVTFAIDCVKDKALKVKRVVESEGLEVKMSMRWPGSYQFFVY